MNELKKMMEFTGMNAEMLIEDFITTLRNFGNHTASREATIKILKTFFERKDYLIHQVMNMDGYNNNLQAISYLNIPRNRSSYDTNDSINNIWSVLFNNGDAVLSKVNEEGKTIEDCIAEDIKDIPDRISIDSLISYGGKNQKSFTDFEKNGFTKKSVKDKSDCRKLIEWFKNYTSSTIDEEMAEKINGINPKVRAQNGMKTTRALGKIIKLYGLEDKTSGSKYNKTFIADYCELMKDDGIRYTYIISVNPIDYLKMSIGHKWKSCHSIKDHGHWHSGTISYMLDSVTLIAYAIPCIGSENEIIYPTTGEVVKAKDHPELFEKYYRNCFHWDEHARLIQSRIYPQGNDGCVDLYKAFRIEAQRQISKANGWNPDAWVQRKDRYKSFATDGDGHTNYSDWSCQRGVNLSTPKINGNEYDSSTPMYIGAQPLCINCGEPHSYTYKLTCSNC